VQRSLLFCCLQDTLTVDFTGVCGGVSCPQIIQHYYIERIHLSVMDFLRFTTKQNWRKVVEEPNQEENRQKNGSPMQSEKGWIFGDAYGVFPKMPISESLA